MNEAVRFHSSEDLIVIAYNAGLSRAYELMKSNHLRHLLVLDSTGLIAGILSERDLFRASYFSRNEKERAGSAEPIFDPRDQVGDYMSWPIHTVDESDSVGTAAKLMIEKKISSLMVTKDRYVTSIITTEDLLKILVSERESLIKTMKTGVLETVYNSPIGAIAEKLASIGI